MLMRTFSGKTVDPVDLQPADIDIFDIAHHLANICRYNGAGKFHYSVAQHSVLLAHAVPAIMNHGGLITDDMEADAISLACLLHDSVEAYISDIPTPLKVSLGILDVVSALEEDVIEMIFSKYALDLSVYERIKPYDTRICENEKDALFPGQERPPSSYPPLAGVVVLPWTPEYAEKQFLMTFKMLTTKGVNYHEH